MATPPTIDLRDIISLTDFQRSAKQHIARLSKTGKPQVLTVNGRAELVVQDAAAYQKLLELAEAGRNKTLSIVAGTVPAVPTSAPATGDMRHPSALPASTIEGKPRDPKPDHTTTIAAAMQELRRNFNPVPAPHTGPRGKGATK